MGLFDLIYKDPNKDKKNEKQTVNKNETKPLKINTTSFDKNSFSTNMENTTTLSTGSVNEEIREYFKKVFTDSNLPGPDYYEFVVALEKMKALPQPEDQKYKNAFIALETMGLSTQKLIETAGEYKKLFGEKLKGFEQHLEQVFAEKVASKQSEIEQLNTENAEIEEKMKELNDKKLSNVQKITALNTEASSNANEINKKKNDFTATYNEYIKEIDNNISLITKYLN